MGKVHVKHIYEIAKIKHTDENLKHIELDALARSIVGSCQSLGIKVES